MNRPRLPARERDQLAGQLAARGWVRLLQQVIEEASVAYWERRARDFEAVGTQTAADTALACRRHAQLVAELGLEQDVLGLLRDYFTDRAAA